MRAERGADWRRDVGRRIVMAAQRCLSGVAACVLELFFVAEHRKSYWNGCMKVVVVICQ